MNYLYVFLVAFVLGFAGGWSFFKHRQDIKDAAKEQLKNSIDAVGKKLG